MPGRKHSPISNQLRLQGWQNGQISELGDAFSFQHTDDLKQQILAIASIAHFKWARSDVEEEKSKLVKKYFPEMILTGALIMSFQPLILS